MLTKRLKSLIIVLLLAGTVPVLVGCGGAVNVQASGGGSEGFASLGVLMLGASAIRYIRDKSYKSDVMDEKALPPPEEMDQTSQQGNTERDGTEAHNHP